MHAQSFALRGPAGELEALLHPPTTQQPSAAAVLCHPHPQRGGNFDSPVVLRATETLCSAGCAVLRFNFRGVGTSAGRYDDGWGENDDLRAAIDALATGFSGLPLVVGGYSFGADRAALVGWTEPRASRLILIAPSMVALDAVPKGAADKPILFIHGGDDAMVPAPPVREFAAALGAAATFGEVKGADHFFDGKLDAVEHLLHGWLAPPPARGAGTGPA